MRAVLDKSLFGDRVIVTQTLDGANPTAQVKRGARCGSHCNRRLQESNLAALCASDFQVSSTEMHDFLHG